ncbi:type II toxin-antitoxin system RelE family toxin [Sphaerospermopsis torques-reginae]|jgi:mRNA interferase RelE/StbE|uniref:Type II toxin-antitoxin system RelE/ParE family toxin n=1 Tax=Sphaerospermopsis torques-reginae ITEP-024 TaxID=984208 RepID=A0ABX8WY26_9CYAN|nr:type II toxin-antitoxin system RelE/ParE family toxin [Sphaerospermopsis torques-reginae]QYX31267.1 type II toxin-antitoxin system RelE/ParE family toxin [Sphaerospermopsis torques-reginae ITEP-024]
MELNFSKNALKFLKKLSDKDTERVRNKILQLLNSVEESGLVPSGELDIKTLEGEWQGFLRMRVGKIRIIFTVDIEQDQLQIYDIGFRGDIYKT